MAKKKQPTSVDALRSDIEDYRAREKQSFKAPKKTKLSVATPKASNAPERLVAPLKKIKIATATGVRTYGVRERTMKKYGAIPNRLVDGLQVFARRISVWYEDLGITRNIAVAPEQKSKYFFNEDIQQFVKYVPTAQTRIVVEYKSGEKELKTVTQEKVREGLYVQKRNKEGKLEKGVYVRDKNVVLKKLSDKERKQELATDGMYPIGVSLAVLFDVDIYNKEGQLKQSGLSITAYSRKNHYRRNRDEMFHEAYRHLLYILIRDYALVSEDRVEYEIQDESEIRYIS